MVSLNGFWYAIRMDDIGLITRQKPVTSRAEVIERLRAQEGAIKMLGADALFMFGSAARDELTSASDVDLFIDYGADVPVTLITIAQLRRILGAALGRTADLTTRDGLHPMLREEIELESRRIF
jgi:uncharacterized protein